VVQLTPELRRPAPPADLTTAQAVVWRAVVDHMPADWFRPETLDLLAAYCRHICRERFLSAELDRCPATALSTEDGLGHFGKLSAAAERESRAALALARSMRLTQQSRYDAAKAARAVGSQRIGPAPWE
jgi:hypothetical protein